MGVVKIYVTNGEWLKWNLSLAKVGYISRKSQKPFVHVVCEDVTRIKTELSEVGCEYHSEKK